MSSDLLFELGTEELPSGAVWPLAVELADNLVNELKNAELKHGKVQRFATPRRLAVLIQDVQETQPDQTITRRGPAVNAATDNNGQPTPALAGFARSCGVSVADLTQLKSDKGEWWVYEATKPGADTRDLLPEMVKQSLAKLTIPKPMRWGAGDDEFARPVHWAVLLWGADVIKTTILGVKTGRHSTGHRFHHPQSVEITTPANYETILHDAYVIADFEKRRQHIIDDVVALADAHHLQAIMPENLIDEVTSIVEWPQPLLANFEADFLQVPAEALIASMQSHQKCFALQDKDGTLKPHFITVSNIASESPQQVVLGNEKVMRARLSDAAFFFKQDKKQALINYADATDRVVFQAKLGTLNDKALRIQTLMTHLIHSLNLNESEAIRAAELCKCDLMTGMVGEFPELQGLMGYYYAQNDGESEAVALALNEQYLPRFAGDKLPESNLGLALSLADRMDTLVGIFAIGQKPTGVKDPFKLRRHALAVVRMLIANPAAINLSTLIEEALTGFGAEIKLDKKAVEELLPFILERMQSFYLGQGIAQEIVLAVRARQEDWLYDVDKRINALLEFVNLPDAVSLSAACKRVNNILAKSAVLGLNGEVDPSRFEQSEETSLYELICATEQQVNPLYLEGRYGEILNHLAKLRSSVDAFFDKVMVMADNEQVKTNRIRLLARLQMLLQGVADISLLTIEK